MSASTILKVRDLPPEARALLQSWLAIPVRDDDELEVSLRPRVSVPTPERKAAGVRRLEELFAKMDQRIPLDDQDEIEAAVDGAVAHVRGRV